MPILLAEDDDKIGKLLVQRLTKDGYVVDWAKDGEEALDYFHLNTYELVLLDWLMPKVDGITVLKTLRQKEFAGGVILLTAKDTLSDKIQGLDGGADDYLPKPFEYSELLARIKAIMRRSPLPMAKDVVAYGAFTHYRQHQSITFEGIDLELSAKEYQLFSLLLENHGNVVPRNSILDRVWGLDQSVNSNTLDAFIRLLRKKMASKGAPNVIEVLRGIGYRCRI